MEEYNKINWRENLLEDNSIFFTAQDLSTSNMHKFLNGQLNIPQIKSQLNFLNKHCEMKVDYPGWKYYSWNPKAHNNRSMFNKIEHQRLISALKVLQSEKLNLNRFELGDRDLYNNCKANMLLENAKYLKLAEDRWLATSLTGITMNNVLFQHALTERMNKLKEILKLEQFYVPVDLLPWSFDESDVLVEMLHVANILDIGVVSQYMPPLLEEPFTLDHSILPKLTKPNYYSKLPMSCDGNIDEFIHSGAADVAISLSALKKIFHYTDTNQLWTIPVVIKEVALHSGGSKKITYFDKPLPKQTISKIDLNLRCHKLLVRANLCRLEGFRYPSQDRLATVNETSAGPQQSEKPLDGGISHNAAYKLWTLKQIDAEHSMMLKNRSGKSFKLLVRTKLDACRQCAVGLQAVTVVPKLEYQLNFGAAAMCPQEIMAQWADLVFRPNSSLQRVRTHFETLEVVKIEPVGIAKVSAEATRQSIKLHPALVVLYKLLLGLERHAEGVYLVRHEPRNGSFVALLKSADDGNAADAFDLHKEYATRANLIHPFRKPWTPIDPNVLLPAFEQHGHMAGLFRPSEAYQPDGKKNKAVKKKFKKGKGKQQRKNFGNKQQMMRK